MVSLIEMFREAAHAVKVRPKTTAGKEWSGYYLAVPSEMKGKEYPYFFGYYLDRPNRVRFETFKVAPIPNAVEIAKCGELLPSQDSPTKQKWAVDLVLDSEEVHFFALSRARQLQALEAFLKTSISIGERIRVDRQPPQ